ncbi:hypothetical protein PUN28_005296 [Cardiocondyla obscurior]|uniref:Uncharacterized protein n=1 Tax=Cardiocondyla obscurior TaxID=286306 RepID=A0AAW2GJQ4_9HYME
MAMDGGGRGRGARKRGEHTVRSHQRARSRESTYERYDHKSTPSQYHSRTRCYKEYPEILARARAYTCARVRARAPHAYAVTTASVHDGGLSVDA